ncbi:hypothetical protein BU251_00330 [Candidatus Velamenicoccus archaeovorus]|uniref:Uncharacterized protein n=1 Tax=Velamenicoccus archaeovorus TaxID=1930593 RepID=A0A410P274_VELA1|nr:hypothetical protein BU251_00330 [Candidatus Velamenicoccus archaeovorus]
MPAAKDRLARLSCGGGNAVAFGRKPLQGIADRIIWELFQRKKEPRTEIPLFFFVPGECFKRASRSRGALSLIGR